jgi:uncharacterized membrane protein YbhN (UPF0104 family)
VTRSATRRRALARVAGSILAFSVILLLLPARELLAAIRSVPRAAWPVAVIAYLLLHLIGVAKWRMVVNAAAGGLGFSGAVRAYYWGLFGNTFLPSVVGGDVVKVATAFRSASSRSGLVLGSVTDRVLDTLGLVLVAGIGAALSPRVLDEQSRRIFGGVAVLAGIAIAAGIAAFFLVPARRMPYRLRRKLVRLRTALRATTSRPDLMVAALVAGMILQILLIVLNSLLGDAMGIRIPLYVWMFVWPLAKLSALLPVTQGGIGVREAALAVLFVPFGVSGAQAVASGLAFTAVVTLGGLIAGLILFLSGSRLVRETPVEAGTSAA